MRKTGRILALVFVSVLVLPVWAQTDKAPAKPEAKAESKPEAKRVARKHNPKRSEDARHCLEKASNTEIIKCAEAYL